MANNTKLWLLLSVVVVGLLYLLAPVLTPFLIAATLAYVTDPIVNYLEKLKVPRTLATTIVFLGIIFTVFLLLFLIIPLLQRQLSLFFAKIPVLIMWLQNTVLPYLSELTGINENFDVQEIKTMLSQHWQQVSSTASIVWQTVSRSSIALVEALIEILIVAVVTFYLLRDWNQLIANIRGLLPRSIEPTVCRLVSECDQVLSAFLRGQLLVMLALAVIYTLGLSLIGLDLALLIGIFIGFISIIPYLGAIIGVVVASIAALMQYHDWLHVGYVLILFLVGHGLENALLIPSLVGNRIGLHPVAVIFALLAGGQLFGFMGVLIALPVASVLVVLLRYAKQQYINSDWYGQQGSKSWPDN